MKWITYPGFIREIAEVRKRPEWCGRIKEFSQIATATAATTIRFIAQNVERIIRLKKGDYLMIRAGNLFVVRNSK